MRFTLNVRVLSLLVVMVSLLVGCNAASESGSTNTLPTESVATATTVGTPQPTAAPTMDTATQFKNPILRANFADPGVLEVDGTYYGYATNGSSKNVQLARSTDLVKWEVLSDAMPALPSWAQLGGGYVWAPEVIQIGDTFVMYYTARDKEADQQCIGVAVSDKPEGKFKDTNDHAFVCQTDQGGSIDPSPFRDEDGTLYLYWKNDGNCCSKPTYLYAQELTPDGLSFVGEPTQLVRNDTAWEGRVVEAPTMWKQDGKYYLFFSGNNYADFTYAVGYATCDSPVGPCTDAPENPILKSVMTAPVVMGPGHQTIVSDKDGDLWLVYHTWEISSAGLRTDRRFMNMDPLVWEDGKPLIQGPTTGPQPLP